MAIKILRQFWLGGRIYLADKIEANPNATLVDFAHKEMAKPYAERMCQIEDEDEATLVVEEQQTNVEDDTTDEEVSNQQEHNEEEDDVEDEYAFISIEEFKALKVNAQIEYISEIENADVDEDDLYQQLVSYKEVAKSKAKDAIDDILSSYVD